MALTTLDPNTALVVIDLQNAVAALPVAPHSAADVIARTAELAEAFRAHKLPVVLVRVSAAPGEWTPGRTESPRRAATPVENGDHIVPALSGHPDDILVTKRNWGAFYGTDLDLHLRRRGITQIVLTGIATSIGVDTTAREAHAHGYHVTLATDAMSDLSEQGHTFTLSTIFPRLGESGTTAEVLDLLENLDA
ncbi:isochorismatase family protein [Kribbella sp. NPDC051770]|uniref:isochorismatase family protein n=1 Tax=Kribbella sp. NPDC051770 TaxID=3155413 RepID=UPI0034179EA4